MAQLASKVINLIGHGSIKTNPNIEGFSLISTDQKATSELGWQPEVEIDDLIAEIWNEYKSRNSK